MNDQEKRFTRVITDLVTSINTDIAPIIQPQRPEGGYFGVPREVFSYVDFLGVLYCGWDGALTKKGKKKGFNAPKKVEAYLRDIMGHVDKYYAKQSELLYEMYRHGTVHIYSPKKMVSNMYPEKTIEWLIYKGNRRSWQYYDNRSVQLRHLKIIQWEKDHYILPLSINVLYDDLIESIDYYRKKVLSGKDGALLKKFTEVADALDSIYDKTNFDFWSDSKDLTQS